MSELGIFYPKNPPEVYTETFEGNLLNPFGTIEKYESIARIFTGNDEWCKLTFDIEGVANNIPLMLISARVESHWVGLEWGLCTITKTRSGQLLSVVVSTNYNTEDKVWDGDSIGIGIANVFNASDSKWVVGQTMNIVLSTPCTTTYTKILR